ncbi:50S ribosomal protein L37ae [Halodesulfurarchaeum sp. HSR-GB]|uniref:50S ribosomal protein L37ae n=1 Tax=Halodesulfurarchaeum sp. HSR-GB TaxID=3074077 RepID=UPI0028572A14|nr:50S ribosomal protein L37ae [Halodesulfurarchaeum sp. HSR-GB]MDR5656738.1 50S ribosomal protein L37ae [Halodesulfurarchaeum sp. HSR-GB]
MSESDRRRRTGSAGRFGARYGRLARRRVAEIEADMHADHVCPECGSPSVDRQGSGIWECGSCGYTFTGGAYRPETPGGRAVTRSIRTALSEDETTEEATEE